MRTCGARMTVVTCGSIPASRSTSTASSAVGPAGRRWWWTASHIGPRRTRGWVAVSSTTTNGPRVRRQRCHEGDRVADVVEDVCADDDVTHRHLVGDVGPRSLVRRDGDPTVARRLLEGPQHRGLRVDGVQVADRPGEAQARRSRPRADVEHAAARREGRPGQVGQR